MSAVRSGGQVSVDADEAQPPETQLLAVDNWGIYGKASASADYDLIDCQQPFSAHQLQQICRWLESFQRSGDAAWTVCWSASDTLLLAYFHGDTFWDQAGRPVARVLLHQLNRARLQPGQILPLLESLQSQAPRQPLQTFALPLEPLTATPPSPALKSAVLTHWLYDKRPLSLPLEAAQILMQALRHWWPAWIASVAVPTRLIPHPERGLQLVPGPDAPEQAQASQLELHWLEDLLCADFSPALNRQVLDFLCSEAPAPLPDQAAFGWLQQPEYYPRLLAATQTRQPFDAALWSASLNSVDQAHWQALSEHPQALPASAQAELPRLLGALPLECLQPPLLPAAWLLLSERGLEAATRHLCQHYSWLEPFLQQTATVLPPPHWEAWADAVLQRWLAAGCLPVAPLTAAAVDWLAEHSAEPFRPLFSAAAQALHQSEPAALDWLERYGHLLSRADLLVQWGLQGAKLAASEWFQATTVLSAAEKHWLQAAETEHLTLDCPLWSEHDLRALSPGLSRTQGLRLVAHYAGQPESHFRRKILSLLIQHPDWRPSERRWLQQRFLSLEPLPALPDFSLTEKLCLWPFLALECDILRPLFQSTSDHSCPDSWPRLLSLLSQAAIAPPPSPSAEACQRHPALLQVLRQLPGWQAFGTLSVDEPEPARRQAQQRRLPGPEA
jgi:hypothetical protein